MGRILTVEQAAQKLQVKPNTIRAWLKKGRIPGVKIGRVYRVSEEELDLLVAAAHQGFGQPDSGPEELAYPPPQRSSHDFMREKREDNAREEWRMLRPDERQRRLDAAMGILADMPFTSEDFMREKREESAREVKRWR